jgi:hypothetical protein
MINLVDNQNDFCSGTIIQFAVILFRKEVCRAPLRFHYAIHAASLFINGTLLPDLFSNVSRNELYPCKFNNLFDRQDGQQFFL